MHIMLRIINLIIMLKYFVKFTWAFLSDIEI